tara:strand:+ start:888 stop:1343 length:456 start_codon:yes stop_codon:yes gene_type:complete
MLYGAYGANLNMANMEVRCPQAKPILGFNLVGYRLVFNGVADIVKDKDAKVPIGLWQITKECEKSLDRFEGYPYLYKKIKLKVDVPGFKGQKVMFYVMRRKGVGLPPAAYFNTIAQGYDDFALDKDYLNWAVHEADQMQKNKLDVFRKVGS